MGLSLNKKLKNYISIARFTYPYEYAILKLLLDRADIHYYFKNEFMADVLNLNFIGNNGIYLMVHQNDKEEAVKILDQFNTTDSPLKLV